MRMTVYYSDPDFTFKLQSFVPLREWCKTESGWNRRNKHICATHLASQLGILAAKLRKSFMAFKGIFAC